MADSNAMSGYASLVVSVLAIAYNHIRGGGVDKQELTTLRKDYEALKTAFSNMLEGFTSLRASQESFNETSKADRRKLNEDMKALERQVNQMEGREDGRLHRER